jgi:hypothetical protein
MKKFTVSAIATLAILASSLTFAGVANATATVPSAPTNVMAVAGNASATVSWTAPSSNGGRALTSYTVDAYSGTTLAAVAWASPTTTSATLTAGTIYGTIANGTTYTFKVVANNAVGASAPSVASTALLVGAPTVPLAVSAIPGNATALVSWTRSASDNGNAISSYYVWAYTSNGTAAAVSGASASATSFTMQPGNSYGSISNGTTYTFVVQANNAVGSSANSVPSSSVTLEPPMASSATIAQAMASTTEKSNLAKYFAPVGNPVVVTDGTATGGITAEVGAAHGAATGTLEAVFFFHNNTFVGLDSNYEKYSVTGLTGAPGTNRVTATYVGTSGASPVSVDFTWNGSAMVPGGSPPNNSVALQVVGSPLVAPNALFSPNSTGGIAGATPLPSSPTGSLNAPIVGMASTPDSRGYWLVAGDGGIFTFGDAGFYGSKGGQSLNAPVVGMASTPDGKGYWLVAGDGGIFCFGDANFYGSKGGQQLNAPVVGMASTPDGKGYWLVASDGGIFTFGDGNFYGSKGGQSLNAPVVGMASTPDGNGYWLVAGDGGIFTFGDGNFWGSQGGKPLNGSVVGMARTPDGNGYWLVASDGGIFTFGDANFYGSAGGQPINYPVVGMASAGSIGGYWEVSGNDGGIFTFGSANFYGSEPGQTGPWSPPAPIGLSAAQAGSCDAGSACGINVQWTVPSTPYATIAGFQVNWSAPGGASGQQAFWAQPSGSVQNVSIFGLVPGNYTVTAVSLTTKGDSGPAQASAGLVDQGPTYHNPFRDLGNFNVNRIDQGVDYSGNGPIYAIGDGTVLMIQNSGWIPIGTFIAYRLSNGPAAGKVVYVAEDLTPNVSVGQSVSAGTVIGTVFQGNEGIEIGWGDPNALGQSMAVSLGEWSPNGVANSTALGTNMSQLLVSLGTRAGQPIAGSPAQSLPAGWPTW